MALRAVHSLQPHVAQKIRGAPAFLDHGAWSNQPVVRIQLDVVLLMVDVHAIVDDLVVGRRPSRSALKVMRYLMRDETSVRSDPPRYHELAIVRQIGGTTILKREMRSVIIARFAKDILVKR